MKKKSLLSDDQRHAVNQVIAEAEHRTAAEIVPAVAVASGRYDRAEDVVGLFSGLALTGVAWMLFQEVGEAGGWSSAPSLVICFPIIAGLMVLGFIVGAIVAGRVFWIRRLFTSNLEMDQETTSRAKAVFFDRRVHGTSEACTVLIYVSLYERRTAILADDAVREKLSERSLEEVQSELLEGVKEGGAAEGLCRGIRRLGELLEAVVPSGDGDRDEVYNEIVVLD